MAKRKLIKRELSKAEKFYIDNNCKTLSLKEICNDLECTEDLAVSFYNECLDSLKNKDTIDKMMVVDSKNGYAVMTKGASEKSEKTRRSEPSKALSKHIHKIR
jgi:hypothetical protein